MGKEFIEYQSEDKKIPYPASSLCLCLTKYAKEYVKENSKITSNIDPKVRDAVLVDAINYLGIQGGCDFALYTEDLYDESKREVEVDPQCLLTAVVNHYAYYIFNQGIVESVLRNNHMNECTEQFDANDGAIVLLDFINYIAKRNDYDRKFTIAEMYEKFKTQCHNNEMRELKKFLELSSKYSDKLAVGVSVDSIFESMASENDLAYIDDDGRYYYTFKLENRLMYPWDAKKVDEEISAIAYAYEKTDVENKEQPKIDIINKKILEMKKR